MAIIVNERNARRVFVRVSINGYDATAYIAPSLLDFSYTDNISGKADEVQLSLQDREARWNGPWKPQKGMQVVASLTVKDWFAQGEDANLACGSFTIDEVTLDGPPDVFKIKAVSATLRSNLREEKKTARGKTRALRALPPSFLVNTGWNCTMRTPKRKKHIWSGKTSVRKLTYPSYTV